jgi:ADP-ribosylglycohydrolase
MMGAIIGDIVGSRFEHYPIKFTDFPLLSTMATYTDDTVTTVAIAFAILNKMDYAFVLKDFGLRYPAGYGYRFSEWLASPDYAPYQSWGNGSAMRVSPVGFAFNSEEEVLEQARNSAAATHDHPEGIKGAQAVALAILRARQRWTKDQIKQDIEQRFGYDLGRTLETIRPGYCFDVSCQGSVPESIIAFLESVDFETAIRNAVSLGGDADTMACIAGGIAQAFYGIPDALITEARALLPDEFNDIINRFQATFG